MESILFSTKMADELNSLVQTQISPHLFLVCNFNPNSFAAINEASKFLLGVANAYKIVVDASLINKLRKIDNDLGRIVQQKSAKAFRKLEDNINSVFILRAFGYHNTDERSETAEEARKWLIGIIKKANFESEADYGASFKALEKIVESIQSAAEEIIKTMVSVYGKDRLCKVFETQIIDFYKTNDNKLIKEELRGAYRTQKGVRTAPDDRVLADWCYKKYTQKIIEKIDRFKSLRQKKTNEQLEKLIETAEKELEKVNLLVAQHSSTCHGDIKNLKNRDYLDYYCFDVINRLPQMIPIVSSKKLSMLPQDILQHLIFNDFEDIILC